ncbi:MAG: glycosyltransferase family 39 protein [bacterium]
MVKTFKPERQPFRRRLSRPDARIYAGVFIIALAVRLLYLWNYSGTPYWEALVMDPGSHWRLARSIAEGQGMGAVPYFRAPLYFYLVAGFMSLFQEPLWPLRIFQAILGSLSAVMTAGVARRYLGRPASALAGLLFAFYWVPVYFDGEVLITTLATFLGLSSLLAVMAADRAFHEDPQKWAGYGLAGMLLGFSALARPNVLVFAAAVALVLFGRAVQEAWKTRKGIPRQGLQRTLAAALLFCLGVAACLAPVTTRNRVEGGEWVLLATQGGINFWMGNNENADGRTVMVPLPRRRIPLRYLKRNKGHPWIKENVWISSKYVAERNTGRTLGDGRVSGYWYKRAFEWMKDDPADAALLWARKALYLFQATEVGNNRDLEYHARLIPVLRLLSYVKLDYFGPLLLAGLVIALGRVRQWRWPLLFFLSYAASVVAFFVTSRYRVPLFPAGMCFAALTLQTLYRAIRDSRNSRHGLARAGAITALVLLCAFLVNMPWPRWNDRPLRSALHYSQGIELFENRSLNTARRELTKALKIKPRFPEARFWLGKVEEEAGRNKEAIRHYKECIRQAPYYAVAHYELGRLYLDMSKDKGDLYYRKAEKHLEKARKLAPGVFSP